MIKTPSPVSEIAKRTMILRRIGPVKGGYREILK
jgi:hypothetical protein